MQSRVVQEAQMLSLRTANSSGEIHELMKLNCPMGQTNLQKLALRNRESTRKAEAK
jgi:hypothetical protein